MENTTKTTENDNRIIDYAYLDDKDRRRVQDLIKDNENFEFKKLYNKTLKLLDQLFAENNPLTDMYPFIPRGFNEREQDSVQLKKLFATLQIRLEKLKKEIGKPPYFVRRFHISPQTYLPKIKKIERVLDDVYRRHIPAYEEMFTELDKRRNNKPYMQEVYIGRDAVFMYQARKIIYILRGVKVTKRLVTYINFPRPFTNPNKLDINRAKRYLKDHHIHSPDNAIFIDTGFKGSVPEYIISTIFGIRGPNIREYMDDHILLIDGPGSRCITKNKTAYTPGHNAITIERAPKHDSVAESLYIHNSGKLEAYGKPNDIGTRFYYDLMRYIIIRHFYLEELYKQGKLKQ